MDRPFRNVVHVGLDCLWGMERMEQVLAAHCVFRQAEFRHRGLPGPHARTCPLSRQGTAEGAHPHACFSRGYFSTAPCTPLQFLWGSTTHTGVPAHTHAHVHTHRNTNVQEYTHRRAHKLTHARTQTQTHARAHMYIHTH